MSEVEPVVVSGRTLQRLREELEQLKTSGREEMAERLRRARDHGDIRENADYDEAKNDQGRMEGRIRHLEHILRHAEVREDLAAEGEAAPGRIVAVHDGEEVEEYLLAESAEEKVSGVRTVTASSPLGKALAGRRVGDKVVVEAPGGRFSVEIVSIRTPE